MNWNYSKIRFEFPFRDDVDDDEDRLQRINFIYVHQFDCSNNSKR